MPGRHAHYLKPRDWDHPSEEKKGIYSEANHDLPRAEVHLLELWPFALATRGAEIGSIVSGFLAAEFSPPWTQTARSVVVNTKTMASAAA